MQHTSHTTDPRPTRQGGRRRDLPAKGGPTAWRGIDLVTLAVLGVALGVAFWAWDTLLYPFVTAALVFPPAQSLTLGVWLLPAVAGGLLVRRPGAALFTELVAANVEMLMGNVWGPAVLLSGLLQGLGVELVLAVFLWRRFGLVVAALAGAMAAVAEIGLYEWWVAMAEYDWAWRFVALGCGVLSGIVVAGGGGWSLVRGLAAAGAVDAFPPGRERLAVEADADETTHA